MPTPPIVRVIVIAPGFLKSLATTPTGTVIVPAPAANHDRNIPAIRFSSNDQDDPQFIRIWKRVAGSDDITDDKLVFGKDFDIQSNSPLEVGPITLGPTQEIAAAIVTVGGALHDDKVNFEVDGWDSDHS